MGTSARKQRNAGSLTHKGLENFDHLGADFKKENFQNGWDEILNKAWKNFVEN